MPTPFMGINSVIDRVLFTNKGPIVKPPIDLLTGSDLQIVSPTDVVIPTGNFNTSSIGKFIQISGTPGLRNDGTFRINSIISSVRLRLDGVNFDIVDSSQTIALVVSLANDLKRKINNHRTQTILIGSTINVVHGTDDSVNIITAPDAVNLSTALTLLADIKANFNAHIIDVSGSPKVHTVADSINTTLYQDPIGLASAICLVNDLRIKFESHRQNHVSHLYPDSANRISIRKVTPVLGVFPGAMTGPFTWVLKDKRTGYVADEPSDVSVIVNGIPVTVEAVFGLLGAIVLAAKPGPTDTVSVDYSFLNNPPSKFLRLNSPEFNLNQSGNNGFSGLPSHRYRARSYLSNSGDGPGLISSYEPRRVGWKYKAFERAYSAVLNDPNSLLLNVPTNKISYPVLFQTIREKIITYDPTSLPQNSVDPWSVAGEGTFSLAPGGGELTIIDSNNQTGLVSKPPFFFHDINLISPSIVSAAFRVYISESFNDGVFTGVSFGFSDGQKVSVIGFILTDATNLTSAITMANSIKQSFNSHLFNIGSHTPNDTSDSIMVVDASDLVSLIILLNQIKAKFNSHLLLGGSSGVHVTPDLVNTVSSVDAFDVDSSISLVNEIRNKFNAHRIQTNIHYQNDISNNVEQVKQIGILTNRGFSEFQESWNGASIDWSILRTYRIFRNSDGDISLFLSGDLDPIASVLAKDLPSISDLDGQFDPVQQVFFGSIGRESTSTSKWSFIRVDLSPLDANLIGGNKSISYDASIIPELDPLAPWITIGQGGFERINSGALILDSTASALDQNVEALGLSSGAYRGFLRLEPILSIENTCSIEFSTSIDFYTHSLDNRSACVLIDDENFSIQFCFLQLSPSPAVVIGSTTGPFSIISGDQFILKLGNDPSITVMFFPSDTSVSAVCSRINLAVGFTLASDQYGHIKLTSSDVGGHALITIISGNALSKIGFSPGPYKGSDSNPEPIVSWFGENRPDQDSPQWGRSGTQSIEMLGRTMRLSDSDVSDYSVFSLTDPIVTSQAFNPIVDWKMDCRLTVISFQPGDSLPSSIPFSEFNFCGGLISIDEGTGGKNVELHLVNDPSTGLQYLNLVSYDFSTNSISIQSQYAFTWGDGNTHSFNIFTSKAADLIFVLADGVMLTPIPGVPNPTYSGLKPGVSGPSINFGSGSEPVSNLDLRTAKSVIDWNSVAVFRDSKISDTLASTRRYVGIFKGGDPSLLDSYYLSSIDWTSLHTYRIVRDPVSSISVYIDSNHIPAISINYDPITLPPVSVSPVNKISNGNNSISFGSFDPHSIIRTRWTIIDYSIGKITLTNRRINPSNVMNRSNAISSPEHLSTSKPHFHAGFSVYSGGTPLDEFFSDPEVPASTMLGEGTPPVPMTENLESRGGLIRVATPVEDVSSLDLVNKDGYISDLEDDTSNVVTTPQIETLSVSISKLVNLANDVQTIYNAHLTQSGVHSVDDSFNASSASPASDLPSAILLLNNIKSKFNLHRVQTSVHIPDDDTNIITAPDATDIGSAAELGRDILFNYSLHITSASFHLANDTTFIVSAPDATDISDSAILADDIRTQFIGHFGSTVYHFASDQSDLTNLPRVSGLGYGSVQLDLITVLSYTIPVSIGDTIKFLNGPNAGLSRVVATISSDSFTVTSPFISSDTGNSSFVRIVSGLPVLDLSSISTLASELRVRFNLHKVSIGIHVINDSLHVPDPEDIVDLASTISVLNSIKAEFNLHRVGQIFHISIDSFNIPSTGPINDPLTFAINLSNEIRTLFNLHLERPRTHLTNDPNDLVLSPVAADLPSLLLLVNETKLKFNKHLIRFNVHLSDDTTNTILSADATDLESAIDLVIETRSKYESHRIQSGVHGSSVFIRLDPPSRVLYEGMKFFTNSVGESGHVTPFSDDETWYIDGFSNSAQQTLSYSGLALPENVQIVSNNLPPFNILGGEDLIISVDGGDPVSVVFQSGDISSDLIVDRINSTLGLPNNLASADSDDRIRLTSPTSGDDSEVLITGGSASSILGFDGAQSTPWFITSTDPDAVTIALLTIGPEKVIRYGTNGPTKTRYENPSALGAVSQSSFQMTVTVRINSVWSLSTNTDTGIYIGLRGQARKKFTVALGFDTLGDFNYIKLQDLRSGKVLYRRAFDWADGNFYTYQITKNNERGTIQLLIVKPTVS